MKKTAAYVLPLLASAAGYAHAQTTTQVYGVMTAGLGYVDKVAAPAGGARATGDRIGLDSGQYTQSRFGFRGIEDLGGGLKAAFTLEGGITIDTGASGQGGLTFGRRTTVALISKDLGSLEIGRRKDFIDEVANQYSSANRLLPYTGKVHGNNLDRSTGERGNNMLFYTTPNFNGFKANLAYGFGETAGSSKTGQSLGFGAMYDNGPFGVGFGYWESKRGVVTATTNSSSDVGATSNAGCNTVGVGNPGETCIKTWMLGSNYDIGNVTLRGAWSQAKQPLISVSAGAAPNFATLFSSTAGSGAFTAGGSNNTKANIFDVGVDYIWNAWKFKGSFIQSRYDFVKATNKGNLTVLALGADYTLSKRTLLYGMVANMHASDMYSPGLTSNGTPGIDNKQNALALGIMHTF